MAQPIQLEFKPRIPEEKVRWQLDRAPVEHADAVLAFYELLQLAHDRGLLDIARGAIGRGDTVIVKLSKFASSPESMALTRNLISLGRIAASFDPEVLGALADELCRQNNGAPARPAESAGLFQAIRRLANKDTLRVLTASAAFLGAFGKALATARTRRQSSA